METARNTSIYLDHAQANVLEYKNTAYHVDTIESNFNHQSKQGFCKKEKVICIIKNII